MNQEDMLRRTRDFAIRIVRLASALPANRVGDIIGRQILRSGTSIGANYREALRASSRRQFITSLEIVQREAHETNYWLDLLIESKTLKPDRLRPLLDECSQLLAIITATITSTKRNGSR